MTQLFIEDIMTEVWDKESGIELYDQDTDNIDMTLTIYKGDSSSEEFESLSITAEEAVQILPHAEESKLFGFTEWQTGTYLLLLDLPERVRSWATEVIAKYIDLTTEELNEMAQLVRAIQGLSEENL